MTPDAVAAHMLDLLQKKEYPCGSVLEVQRGSQRLIPEWNISPTVGRGTGKDIDVDALMEPVLKKLESEKKKV